MVIGYGFRDVHVNNAIDDAVGHGLRMFVFDPAGAELALRQNKTRQPGQITAPTNLERTLQRFSQRAKEDQHRRALNRLVVVFTCQVTCMIDRAFMLLSYRSERRGLT